MTPERRDRDFYVSYAGVFVQVLPMERRSTVAAPPIELILCDACTVDAMFGQCFLRVLVDGFGNAWESWREDKLTSRILERGRPFCGSLISGLENEGTLPMWPAANTSP